jgi:hypothetical protein
MKRTLLPALLFATGVVLADEEPKVEPVVTAAKSEAQKEQDAKALSGMSVLGNQEAPKALVIVPGRARRSATRSAFRRCSTTPSNPSTKTCS